MERVSWVGVLLLRFYVTPPPISHRPSQAAAAAQAQAARAPLRSSSCGTEALGAAKRRLGARAAIARAALATASFRPAPRAHHQQIAIQVGIQVLRCTGYHDNIRTHFQSPGAPTRAPGNPAKHLSPRGATPMPHMCKTHLVL